MIFEQPLIITLADAWIAIYILVGIVAIEVGIIGGLATRVGGLRRLFRLTALEANKRTDSTNQEKSKPANRKEA